MALVCTVFMYKPFAYSWDQDHDAICAACEGKYFPGSSCSGGWGSRPGKWVQSLGFLVQPALLLLPDWSSLLGTGVKWEGL